MTKRLVAAAVAAAGLVAPIAAAAPAHATVQSCTHISVTVNGTNQTVDKCIAQ